MTVGKQVAREEATGRARERSRAERGGDGAVPNKHIPARRRENLYESAQTKV